VPPTTPIRPQQTPELSANEFASSASRGFGRLGAWFRALRPKQWVKNLLLLVPLITAHQVTDAAKIELCLWGFVAFSLCASSVYLVNDVLDVQSDRAHPRKRKRPFASGELTLAHGPIMAVVLLAAGLGLAAWRLPPAFVGLLALYLALTAAYSFWLKAKIIVDVVLLAMLYALRIVAGGVATGIEISAWLAAFSLFIFTSLAFAKRYAELVRIADEPDDNDIAHGRGYRLQDIRLIESMGPTCGMISVLVLALYIQSPAVTLLYPQPRVLWLLCPLLLYWIGRLWLVAGRKELSEDPISYAITDPRSLAVAASAAAILALGSLLG
jgi:4-hydroxybenzoate polyprenyltransferase